MVYYLNTDGSLIHSEPTQVKMAQWMGVTQAKLNACIIKGRRIVEGLDKATEPYVYADKKYSYGYHRKKCLVSGEPDIPVPKVNDLPPIGDKVLLWFREYSEDDGGGRNYYAQKEFTIMTYYKNCVCLKDRKGMIYSPNYWEFFKRMTSKI